VHAASKVDLAQNVSVWSNAYLSRISHPKFISWYGEALFAGSAVEPSLAL